MEKQSTHRKKQFVPNAFKFLVAVGSMAGTLGIWNILSNKDLALVNAQNGSSDQPTITPDQALLPTLAPLLRVEQQNAQTVIVQPTTIDPLKEVARPTTLPNASTSLNQPQNSPVVIPPAPVTRTQSSKP